MAVVLRSGTPARDDARGGIFGGDISDPGYCRGKIFSRAYGCAARAAPRADGPCGGVIWGVVLRERIDKAFLYSLMNAKAIEAGPSLRVPSFVRASGMTGFCVLRKLRLAVWRYDRDRDSPLIHLDGGYA